MLSISGLQLLPLIAPIDMPSLSLCVSVFAEAVAVIVNESNAISV